MIYDIVNNMNKKFPEKICIKSKQKEITYRELYSQIIAFAERMKKDGLVHGQKVLILLPNTSEYVISFFAINLAGGIAVVIDTKLNDELHKIIIDNNINYFITNETGMQKLNSIFAKNKNEQNFEEPCKIKLYITEEMTNNKLIYSNENIEERYDNQDLDRTSVILYTSGSIGTPKGVINSHRTLQNALNNYCETVVVNSSDILVAVTPFFHSYAFGSCMLAGLANGATLLVQDSFNPKRILNLISNERATIFHGVPYMYSLINDQIKRTHICPDSLRLCISAGGPLNEEVAREFHTLTGKIIHQEYGSTETGTIAINLADDLEKNIKSVGKSLKNVSVRIGGEIEDESVLYIKSRGQSIGYVDLEPFSDDWYNTEDIIKIDTDGYIYIVGRKKRMISVSGLKVNPMEVELYLLKHPDIDNVMVKGHKDEDFGEIVEVFIKRKNCDLSEQDIIMFCQGKLAAYKIPKIINWVESLPQSATGKIISTSDQS